MCKYHLRWHGLEYLFHFFRKYALAEGFFFNTLPVSLVVTQTHAQGLAKNNQFNHGELTTPLGRQMSKK